MEQAFWASRVLWLKAMVAQIVIHFFFAIQTAIEESKNNVLEKIQKQLDLEMPLDITSSEHI